VIDALEQFIDSARWFGGKGRGHTIGEVRRLGWLNSPDEPFSEIPRVRIEFADVKYDDGQTEVYQLPLAYYSEAQDRLDHALVGRWEDEDLGPAWVYDAVHDREATAVFLQAFDTSREVDGLVFHRLPGYDLDLDARSTLFSGEQSNSSVAFGEDSLMKVFRKVTPGRNPDIEIHDALTRADNEHVAALYGWLEVDSRNGGEPMQLAMLQQFLRTASDGWNLALASVRDLFAEADLHADEVGGDFASESNRLGVATAEVHEALGELFPSETYTPDQMRALAQAMTGRLEAAIMVVPDLVEHAQALREAFAAVGELAVPTVVQRVHGDLHLGQTLRTVKGWKIVDFEGEPAKPLDDRVLPDSPWRDVAGMLRSFDYAAHAVEADVEEGAQIAYRALEWIERNQEAFLAGYAEGRGVSEDAGLSADEVTLLGAYVLDKAVYETVYEARNRPTWLHIPLGAVARLVATRSASAHAEENGR
jgi:maltokinase